MTIEEKIREAYLAVKAKRSLMPEYERGDLDEYLFREGYLALLNSLGRIGVVGGGDDLYFLPKGITHD